MSLWTDHFSCHRQHFSMPSVSTGWGSLIPGQARCTPCNLEVIECNRFGWHVWCTNCFFSCAYRTTLKIIPWSSGCFRNFGWSHFGPREPSLCSFDIVKRSLPTSSGWTFKNGPRKISKHTSNDHSANSHSNPSVYSQLEVRHTTDFLWHCQLRLIPQKVKWNSIRGFVRSCCGVIEDSKTTWLWSKWVGFIAFRKIAWVSTSWVNGVRFFNRPFTAKRSYLVTGSLYVRKFCHLKAVHSLCGACFNWSGNNVCMQVY